MAPPAFAHGIHVVVGDAHCGGAARRQGLACSQPAGISTARQRRASEMPSAPWCRFCGGVVATIAARRVRIGLGVDASSDDGYDAVFVAAWFHLVGAIGPDTKGVGVARASSSGPLSHCEQPILQQSGLPERLASHWVASCAARDANTINVRTPGVVWLIELCVVNAARFVQLRTSSARRILQPRVAATAHLVDLRPPWPTRFGSPASCQGRTNSASGCCPVQRRGSDRHSHGTGGGGQCPHGVSCWPCFSCRRSHRPSCYPRHRAIRLCDAATPLDRTRGAD
mmetsp:Transcript_86434/g.241855  ORF Transcript_86434/g.241855 Transcript_86434/m.241855 type:complete len:283 (+) Transcript_86434:1021-1869(+)